VDLILEGLMKAFHLIFSWDREVLGITWLSLKVSGIATLISVLIGISLGMIIALSKFPGKKLLITVINTGMGLPPVVVGLFVTVFLWRNGPFALDILYTSAMIIAQVVTQIVVDCRWPRYRICPRC
jgi:tungstate transport system permease protein